MTIRRYSEYEAEKSIPRLFQWMQTREREREPWARSWPGDPDDFADEQCEVEGDDLRQAIAHSRRLLTMDDADDDAEAVVEATWHRAISLLQYYATSAHSELGATIGVPSISAADNASIDLYWSLDSRRLLINVPADRLQPARFYGEGNQGDRISGSIVSDIMHVMIVTWLAAE